MAEKESSGDDEEADAEEDEQAGTASAEDSDGALSVIQDEIRAIEYWTSNCERQGKEVQQQLVVVKSLSADLEAFSADSKAAAKQSDEASRNAQTGAKDSPDTPKLAKPKGKGDKAKYASAIELSGNVRNRVHDAELKVDELRDQQRSANDAEHRSTGIIAESQRTLNGIVKAADIGFTMRLLERSGEELSEALPAAKKKVKDAGRKDPAVKSELDAKFKELLAAGRRVSKMTKAAKSENKQMAGMAKAAKPLHQEIEKRHQQIVGNHESVVQLAQEREHGLVAFRDVLKQADQQEAECKSRLDDKDANEILEARYAELGGDQKLTRALADEDKAFRANLILMRAELSDWQKDRKRELTVLKQKIEASIALDNTELKEFKVWHAEESKQLEALNKEVAKLGDKLKTEPGKELMRDIRFRTEHITGYAKIFDRVEKGLELDNERFSNLDSWLKNVDEKHEKAEEILRNRTTEQDNVLELRAMTLQQKVDYLEANPKQMRDNKEKKLRKELDWTVKGTEADVKYQRVEYRPAEEADELMPFEWGDITETVQSLINTPIEGLSEDGPELAKLREKYEAMGGDRALFRQLVADWKRQAAADEQWRVSSAKRYQEKIESSTTAGRTSSQGMARQRRKVCEVKRRTRQSGERAGRAQEDHGGR